MITFRRLFFFALLIVFLPNTPLAKESKELSVNDAAKLALKNNYDIKVANYDVDINKLNINYAKAAYDGILSFKTGYMQDKNEQIIGDIFGTDNRTYNFDFGFSKLFSTGTALNVGWNNSRNTTNSTFAPMSKYWDSSWEFGVSQSLLQNFAGMMNRLNVEIARINTEILDLSVQERIETKLFTVITLYWDLYQAKENLKITKKSLKAADKLLSITKNKLKRGLMETGDVYAFEALKSLRQRDVLFAEKTYKDAADALKFELGLGKDDINVIAGDKPALKKIALELSENLEEAFKARRDYVSMKKTIEGKDLEVKMYSNTRYPKLDLVASLRANGLSNTYGDAFGGASKFSDPMWFLGLEFEFNVDDNEAKSNYVKAKIEKAQNLIELKKVEATILNDVRLALRSIRNSEKQVAETARAKKYQKLKLKEEKKKFGQGRSRSETIVNYETDLLDAQLVEIIARVAYEKSIVELLYAKNALLARFLL